MRRLSVRRHAGRSADFEFVESYYRMMMSGGGHVVTVRMTRHPAATGTDDGDQSTPPCPHVLYAERRTRYLSYASKLSEGSYATRYAKTSYSMSNDERLYRTEYCFMQDGQRTQLFQTLNGTSVTGTLLFESEMPYTMQPTMMVEQGSHVILCLNALHSDSKVLPSAIGNRDDDIPIYTGYLYVIDIDMLSGQWTPLFESNKPIRHSVHGVIGQDGKTGILIANICDDKRGALPMPRAFKDIPRYVMEDSPHEGPSMNVPYGISVYSPGTSSFTLVPIGGNAQWGIAGIDIADHGGIAASAHASGEETRGMNVLLVIEDDSAGDGVRVTGTDSDGALDSEGDMRV